ncbi:MAG TPA: Uma2 family endonuclease [Aggregatilineales bacterium]|nr:Uma2 family endonuclease [Aggregatilineales bacterium]
MVSNSLASRVTFKIGGFLFAYLQIHPIGEATTADGGYMVNGERYIPNIGFILHDKLVGKEDSAYYPIAPDLAVEVISNPTNHQEMRDLRLKLVNYLQAGTTVWVIDPYARTGEIYTPNEPIQIISEDGLLNGGAVLPNFTVALKDILPPSDAIPVS